MKKVDIVIPIYNAYDFTDKCIDTVIQNTDLKYHTLVLINDKSTDERMIPLLEKKVKENENLNIVFINSEENHGFVRTVNIGMQNSSNDVILLNSDTEVTKNWIEKIQKCAYSKEMVATVTPLSNNATLASVPVFNAENDIPKDMSLEEYAEIIEKCSMNIYPEIPTAHGFCMYIKREAIEVIGLFDEVTYEKGYGEENDFSYRCLEAGYRHLLCDNTFIYHKGTQSFSEEKTAFVLSHLKILQEQHPECFKNTDDFVHENPLEYIQQNVIYAINSYKRKNVLILVHDFRELKYKNLGGTTLHIYDIINNLRDKMNFHIIYPYVFDGKYYLKSFFKDSEYTHKLGDYKKYTNISLYNDEFKEDLEEIISILNIDLIHIHHLKDLYLDVFNIANERNIPIIYSLHDFYSICPTIKLLNENNEYCGSLENKNCNECIKNKLGIESDVMTNWHKEFHKCLKSAKKLIVPSNNTKQEILKVYNDLNIDVIEHGFDVIDETKEEKSNDGKFNIAFIGGITEEKGLEYLKGLVSKVEDTDIVIHLFGTTNDAKYNANMKNYIFHDVYDREDISNLLHENNIELACMLQIGPETYSYILTESLVSKVPVIAFDIGTVADRVKTIDAGYILPAGSTIDDVYNKIVEIKNNKEEYNSKKQNIEEYVKNLKSIKEMASEYEKVYDQILYEYANEKREDLNVNIYKEKFYIKKEYYIKLNKEFQKYKVLNENYASVVNSRRWQILGNIKIPKTVLKLNSLKNKIRNKIKGK